MALGPEQREVLRIIARQGLRLAVLGTGMGFMAALGLTSILRSPLFGVQPTDALTFLSVLVVLIGVSLLASYIPARRATKVDPMVAPRYE